MHGAKVEEGEKIKKKKLETPSSMCMVDQNRTVCTLDWHTSTLLKCQRQID